MDVDTARAAAAEALLDMERPGQPLVLLDPENPVEHEWCYLFAFNAVRAVEGDRNAMMLSGPVVVPKDGAPPWAAPSSRPVERWLNDYAASNNLPPVPMPPLAPNPFAPRSAS